MEYYSVAGFYLDFGADDVDQDLFPEEKYRSKENAMKRALEEVAKVEKEKGVSLERRDYDTCTVWSWDNEAEYKANYPYGPWRCNDGVKIGVWKEKLVLLDD